MTLTEFLLARIAEDETEAADADGTPTPIGMWDDARVLAECEAKRRIVEAFTFSAGIGLAVSSCCALTQHRTNIETLRFAMQALALSYADHPDYDEEWRP